MVHCYYKERKGDRMAKSIQDTYTLSNGVKIPVMGLGVYKNVDETELEAAVTVHWNMVTAILIRQKYIKMKKVSAGRLKIPECREKRFSLQPKYGTTTRAMKIH